MAFFLGGISPHTPHPWLASLRGFRMAFFLGGIPEKFKHFARYMVTNSSTSD